MASTCEINREAMRADGEGAPLERLDGAIAPGLADVETGRLQEMEALRRELRGAATDGRPAA
ncbi:MAG: hypothetical protein RLZZ117_1791 [Cyanobacteriota bacterium]|jgi:hypothetical protein